MISKLSMMEHTAFSTEIDGRSIGTFGDITVFSFHATKLFNTLEGGCLTYNDEWVEGENLQFKKFWNKK